MARPGGAMHVVTTRRQHGDKVYETHLLRRSYREDGKVKNQTLANLSHLPPQALRAVKATLRGQVLIGADEAVEISRSLPHGHVAAVVAQANALGLPALLGPAGRARDLAFALIVARVCRPGSKLATTRWWADTTLAHDLGIADASTDEVYAALDWLVAQQDNIEAKLARRHLSGAVNPDRLALFDLSSSWVTGSCCPLAARGYSRDGKKGLPQIEYGLLTDPDGRPVAVRVLAGNTADPAEFALIATEARDKFSLRDMVLVGDRGMITTARIEQLRELGGFGWITALRAPAIAALAADDGPLQMSLFDQTNLAEISHPDYPG
ncbi:MAG: IS1634 family transposase, partial [Actinomycetes bacterium]